MKVSIITATLNSEKTISATLASVQSQTHDNIEHIIVDGASTDTTLQLVKRENLKNLKVYSEKDKGLYHALNRGIDLASGDIIGFLHSDDLFETDRSVSIIVNEFEASDANATFSDLSYVSHKNIDRKIRHWVAGVYRHDKLKKGWMPPHPTVFLRKEVFEHIGRFDTSYKISADYDFLLRFLKDENYRISYIPCLLYKMRTGGISNRSVKNIAIKMSEDLRIIKNNNIGGIKTLLLKNMRKFSQFSIPSSKGPPDIDRTLTPKPDRPRDT